MATTINAGRVRFVSRGTYNNSTQYYLFDLVDYNGSSYIAKENTVGNLPTNTQYWQLIAEKGNTGNPGATGATGATGNGIESITKTATVGLVDTYTITYTDGTTTTFTVTNGEDGEVTQAQFDELQQEIEDQANNQIILDATPSTSLYIPDSASAKNREIGIVGNKEQYSTTGKQAIISLYEKSLNSITWSFDKNKAVSSMVFSGIVSVGVDTAAVYIQTSEGAIRLPTYLTESANTKFTYNATLSETILTNIANSTFNPRISIYKGGVDFSNATYSEMMLRDSTTTDTYEPYTGRNSLS